MNGNASAGAITVHVSASPMALPFTLDLLRHLYLLVILPEYQAYGSIVDDLAERFVGSGLPPDEEIYRALMLAYGR